MRPFALFASGAALCVVLFPFVMPSCGGSTTTPPTQTGGGNGGSTGSAGSDATGTGASGTSVVGGAGSMQQGGAAGTAIPATDTCAIDDDCTWGELPNEILNSTDCICTYGCVYLPQTKVTAMRRGAQYKALCNPNTDGKGHPCGIDDCAGPGAIACIEGACKPAPKDAGMTQ